MAANELARPWRRAVESGATVEAEQLRRWQMPSRCELQGKGVGGCRRADAEAKTAFRHKAPRQRRTDDERARNRPKRADARNECLR